MKANELRIGNYIFEYGISKIADALLILGMSQIESANKIVIDISPIPLTEEWLLKFSFENYANAHFFKFYRKESIKVSISEERNAIIVRVYESPLRYYDENLYVHQLQNLYFALEGEELQIKE